MLKLRDRLVFGISIINNFIVSFALLLPLDNTVRETWKIYLKGQAVPKQGLEENGLFLLTYKQLSSSSLQKRRKKILCSLAIGWKKILGSHSNLSECKYVSPKAK